jgi:hypothetical protein
MYKILPYSFEKAKKLNVIILPSDNPKHKIEVYNSDGVFMFYIGDPNYFDYPYYLKDKGKEYADERRRLYRIRHKKDRNIPNTPGYYADKILW